MSVYCAIQHKVSAPAPAFPAIASISMASKFTTWSCMWIRFRLRICSIRKSVFQMPIEFSSFAIRTTRNKFARLIFGFVSIFVSVPPETYIDNSSAIGNDFAIRTWVIQSEKMFVFAAGLKGLMCALKIYVLRFNTNNRLPILWLRKWRSHYLCRIMYWSGYLNSL